MHQLASDIAVSLFEWVLMLREHVYDKSCKIELLEIKLNPAAPSLSLPTHAQATSCPELAQNHPEKIFSWYLQNLASSQ